MDCMCGDPYCPSCGNPNRARVEEAEINLIDACVSAGLTVEEYAVVRDVGLRAVEVMRGVFKSISHYDY